MELFELLDPVSLDKPEEHFIASPNIFGKHLTTHTPSFQPTDLSQYDVALLGVPEDRNSFNRGASLAPGKVREQLYKLYKLNVGIRLVDLGNLKQGNTFNDTYVALREVLNHLADNNVLTILIGGTQELTVPVFQVFEARKKVLNLTTIDRTIDIVKDTVKTTAESYLAELLFKKRKLFKFCNLGHQVHVTDTDNVELISKLYHDCFRLGEIRHQLPEVEPILRDSHIISFDISAVRHSEAPGYYNPSPSGFYSEEACQLAKYAGMSNKALVFGLFEVNPKYDQLNQTASLAAQIIWYFLDGFTCRNLEEPQSENSNFKTFIVGHTDLDYEMTFYKSLVTERWWMEIPDPNNKNNPRLVSCSYSDYQTACEQEVPDLWLKSFQKLS